MPSRKSAHPQRARPSATSRAKPSCWSSAGLSRRSRSSGRGGRTGGDKACGRALCGDRRCCALFIVSGVLRCRKCHSLTYRSQHTLNPALTRAAKLRRKLGAASGLLSRIPPRPPHWRRDYWARTLADLAAAESVIGELLGATLRKVKRRKARFDGPR